MIEENFIKIYERSFKENWELPALTDYNEQKTYTYQEVAKEIARLHLLFRHCKIRRGDKIALVGKNTPRWCIAFLLPLLMEPSLYLFCRSLIRETYNISLIIPTRCYCLQATRYGKI